MLTPFLLRLQSAIRKGAGGPLGEEAKKRATAGGSCVPGKDGPGPSGEALELAQRQISRLRHDLKSLDEIHRKYEEKKQEMTLISWMLR